MSTLTPKLSPALSVTELSRLLQTDNNGPVALLGIDDQSVAAALQQALPDQPLDCVAADSDWFEALSELARYTIVYVCAGSLCAVAFEQRLAALRDRCQGRLVVEENNAAPVLSESHYFALGFRRQEQPGEANQAVDLFAYSLRDYKTPPDWLNAKYWAHPERWNLPE